eukprot:3934814-Rhodomonas_salina.1
MSGSVAEPRPGGYALSCGGTNGVVRPRLRPLGPRRELATEASDLGRRSLVGAASARGAAGTSRSPLLASFLGAAACALLLRCLLASTLHLLHDRVPVEGGPSCHADSRHSRELAGHRRCGREAREHGLDLTHEVDERREQRGHDHWDQGDDANELEDVGVDVLWHHTVDIGQHRGDYL